MNAPYYVEILSGNREMRYRHRVDALPIRIGRAYDNDVILDDPHTSARHAIVEQTPEGGLMVRDTGSRNGILHKKKREKELAIDGNTVFRLGHTALRIRSSDFQVAEEKADTAFHNWEGWLPALAGLVLLMGVAALNTWLETTGKFEGISFLMAIVIVVCLGMTWCGVWSFANRLFGGKARLGRHLFILGCGFAAMNIWEMACSAIAYSLSWETLARYGSHGEIAIFAVMIYFHLMNIKPARYRRFAVTCVIVALLCSGIRLMYNYSSNGMLADELFMKERFPPSIRISSDKPVSRLISDAATLKAEVDRERAKLVLDDSADGGGQD